MQEWFAEGIFPQHPVLLFLQQLRSANPPATSCFTRYKQKGPGASGGPGEPPNPTPSTCCQHRPLASTPRAHAHRTTAPAAGNRRGTGTGHTGVDGNRTSSINSWCHASKRSQLCMMCLLWSSDKDCRWDKDQSRNTSTLNTNTFVPKAEETFSDVT